MDSLGKTVEEVVEKVMREKLSSLLHDIDYRIDTLYQVAKRATGLEGRYGSADLNLAHHILDGFVFTDNKPIAGKVKWDGCHIVYKGTDHEITDGDTDKKYVYWQLATPTVFATDDDKPELGSDDVLVAINDGGVANIQLVPGKMTHGAAVVDGTVDSAELSNGAVIADKIGALAVTEGKVGAGAITTTKLGDKAVASAKLGDNAVTETKINDSAITSGKIKDGAVTEGKVGAGAITTTKLGDKAVASGKLGDNAVTETKLGDNAVTSGKIKDGAVIGTKIVDNAITGPKIVVGSVASDKLNVAIHMIY